MLESLLIKFVAIATEAAIAEGLEIMKGNDAEAVLRARIDAKREKKEKLVKQLKSQMAEEV